MSDTHVEKDKIIRVDYNEFLANLADDTSELEISDTIAGAIAGAAGAMPGATPGTMVGPFVSNIFKRLRGLRKSNPTDTDYTKEWIKAGREAEATGLKIKMDKSTMIGIKIKELEKLPNVNGVIGVQTENHVTLEVEFNNQQ